MARSPIAVSGRLTIGEDLERVRLQHRAQRVVLTRTILGRRSVPDDAGHRQAVRTKALDDATIELAQIHAELATLGRRNHHA